MLLKIRRFIRLNKPLVAYTALLFIGIGGLFFGLIPSLQKSIVLVKDLKTMNEDMSRIQKKVNLLSTLDQTVLEQYGEVVLTALPEDKSVSTLLSTADALAEKNNLSTSDLSIEGIASLSTASGNQPVKPEGHTLSETISLQGELINLRNFLSDCMKVRRLMRVKSLSLSAVPKSTQMSAKLTLEFFYLALPSSIGKPSDPLDPFSQKELEILEKLSSYPIAYQTQTQSASGGQTAVIGEEPAIPALLDPFSRPRSKVTPTPSSGVTPAPSAKITPVPTTKLTPSGTPKTTPALSPTSRPTPSPTP